MSTDDADGAPGGVTQVRAVTVALTGLAKERGLPVVLVGHVTKDGSIAGPRVLEHLVDVVLSFEGDKHSTLRMVRGVKNRFGPADEVGCFELRDAGIVGMPDPSGLFLARFGGPPVPGHRGDRRDGRPPPAAGRGAGAGGRQGHPQPAPRRQRPGQRPRRDAAGRARDAGRACGCTTPRCTRRRSAACGSSSRPPTSPWRWRSPRPAATSRCRRTSWCSARSAWPARSAGWPGVERRLAEAARLGFTHALVPAGQRRQAPDGMRVHGGRRRGAGAGQR